LAFIVSFDEVIVALFITGGKMSTITRSMFLALRDQIDPTIASISTIMVLITTIALILAQIFGQSKDK
jgi:putative spermidine/putrescine transport system permease protein